MSVSWAPLTPDGAPAPANSTGYWLSQGEDLVATDANGRVALWSADSLPTCFPRGWPNVFKESAVLKQFVNKSQLKGVRCRAVDRAAPPSVAARKSATAANVPLHALHSFSNALSLSEELGWTVVKGFLVLESVSAGAASATSFVALRHWWNATSDGAWVDLTPPLLPDSDGEETRVLLVESALGEKAASSLTPARQQFAVALAERLAKGLASLRPSATKVDGAAAAIAAVDVSDNNGRAAATTTNAAAGKPNAATTTTTTTSAASSPQKKSPASKANVDYSKWDALDVSDDDEEVNQRQMQESAAKQKELMERAAAQQQVKASSSGGSAAPAPHQQQQQRPAPPPPASPPPAACEAFLFAHLTLSSLSLTRRPKPTRSKS